MAKVTFKMAAEKLANQWKKGKIPRSYRVKKGQGYYDIAQQVYGDQKYGAYAGAWQGLEAANQSAPLQPGQRVRITKPTLNRARYRWAQPKRVRAPRKREQKAPTVRL